MQEEKHYYLGLDVGTDSVGWCLTDQNYHIIKKGGKSLWGVRLFNEAESAEERSSHRSQRRERNHKRMRLDLLDDLFTSEIYKVDPTFLERLKESGYQLEDREINKDNQYTLFINKEYTDRDYYKEYPTIFHLREHLLYSDKKEDIRLIYLACHSMLKHRGNFLETNFDPAKPLNEEEIEDLFEDIYNFALDISEGDIVFNYQGKTKEINKLFSLSKNTTQLMEGLNNIFSGSIKSNKNIIYDVFIPLISGRKKTFKDLLNYLDIQEEVEEEDLKKSLELDQDDFDLLISDLKCRYPEYEDALECIIDCLKIRNMFTLSKFLGNDNPYISVAMVKQYDEHQKDLVALKRYVKKNYSKDVYYKIFRSVETPNNYVHYIGYTSNRGKTTVVKKCSQKVFYSFLSSTLEIALKADNEQDPYKRSIKEKMDNNAYLLKQRNPMNGIYPYQLNEFELRTILNNQKKYYPFLNQEDGNKDYPTVADKIVSILTFAIPYYVGPLYTNDNEDDQRKKNSWIVKYDKSPILPWTFNQVVDIDKTAEESIRRMQNKCTYLKGSEDYCLPKKSIIFSYYNLLNFLNKLYIDGAPMTKSVRDKLIKDLYLNNKKVSIKKIKDWFKENYSENVEITTSNLKTLDQEPDANMSSCCDLKRIFYYSDSQMKGHINDLEKLIKDITIFEDKNVLERKLRNAKVEYPTLDLDQEKIKSIKALNYKGWSKLSGKLLTKIISSNGYSILEVMDERMMNFEEVLYSEQYDFREKISQYNIAQDYDPSKMSIDEYINGLYTNAAVKRSLKQTYLIITELEKIVGHKIDKYFIEFTRHDEEKVRTKSRKEKLVELYKPIRNEYLGLSSSLDEEVDLRDDRLYLYYLQLGRCMYSGEEINRTRLSQDYEIDHIVPWSVENNDSINNKVLVKKECNQEKSDVYPLKTSRLWLGNGGYKEAENFWVYLKNHNLIGGEKYRRLTRREPLKESDFDKFISSQLADTNQSVKALSNLLVDYMHVDKVKSIVYSKAENVSYYRKWFDIYKSRTANNFHHAHDAFLNIVVGDIVDKYFTNRYAYKVNGKEYYTLNIQKVFQKDYISSINGEIIYDKKDIYDLVEKQIFHRFDIMTTTRVYENNTLLHKSSIVEKGKASYPAKRTGPYTNLKSYGGFDNPTYSYYTLIKTKVKDQTKTMLIPIPAFYKNDPISYIKNIKGITEFELILQKVKTNNVFLRDKTKFCITGNAGKCYALSNLKERIFSKEDIKTIHDIDKLLDLLKKANISINSKLFNSDDVKSSSEREKIEKQFAYKVNTNQKDIVVSPKVDIQNQKGIVLYEYQLMNLYRSLYTMYLRTDKNGFKEYGFTYISSPNGIAYKLISMEKKFEGLDLLKQIYTLSELLKLLDCTHRMVANLEFIGLPKNSGTLAMYPTMPDHFRIIAESPTGYYTKVLYEQ